jgi:hypothetical protein
MGLLKAGEGMKLPAFTCEFCFFADICQQQDPDFDKNDLACDLVLWKKEYI